MLCQLVLHLFFARTASHAQGYYSHCQTTRQPCTVRKCYGQTHCHSNTALFQTSTCWHDRNHSSKVLKCCTSETCSPSLCQITFLSKCSGKGHSTQLNSYSLPGQLQDTEEAQNIPGLFTRADPGFTNDFIREISTLFHLGNSKSRLIL